MKVYDACSAGVITAGVMGWFDTTMFLFELSHGFEFNIRILVQCLVYAIIR